MYHMAARYAHAEARKSPVVDGKVLRTSDGKEMRFPVLLTPQEKEVARQVGVVPYFTVNQLSCHQLGCP